MVKDWRLFLDGEDDEEEEEYEDEEDGDAELEEEEEEEEKQWRRRKEIVEDERIKGVTSLEAAALEIVSSRAPLYLLLKLADGKVKRAKELVDGRYTVLGEERRIPRSTLYKVLKRFYELDLVNWEGGFDKRSRYYKLNEKGREVLKKVALTIKYKLKDRLKPAEELAKELESRGRGYYSSLKRYKYFYGAWKEEFPRIVEEAVGLPASLVLRPLLLTEVDGAILLDYTAWFRG